ncbi:PheST operon leader peptide PheM [Rahnella bruchi]
MGGGHCYPLPGYAYFWGNAIVMFTTYNKGSKLLLLNTILSVVILVVLTEREFRIFLFISQLLAKAIPVRGAKLEKPA